MPGNHLFVDCFLYIGNNNTYLATYLVWLYLSNQSKIITNLTRRETKIFDCVNPSVSRGANQERIRLGFKLIQSECDFTTGSVHSRWVEDSIHPFLRDFRSKIFVRLQVLELEVVSFFPSLQLRPFIRASTWDSDNWLNERTVSEQCGIVMIRLVSYLVLGPSSCQLSLVSHSIPLCGSRDFPKGQIRASAHFLPRTSIQFCLRPRL